MPSTEPVTTRQTRRIGVFYHIWAPGGSDTWRLLIDEQLKRLFRSGIINAADVFCCISGPKCAEIEELVNVYRWVNIIECTPDEQWYEGLTLHHLWRACCDNPNLLYVAYVHTKGIRYLSSPCPPEMFRAVNSWRHFLETGVIDRWRDVCGKLDSFDVVGVNHKLRPWSHMSGNMWWASAQYVRSLIDPRSREFPLGPALGFDEISMVRLNYERWIGLNAPSVFSFCDQPFAIGGVKLDTDEIDMYQNDVEPFYRSNMI